MSKKNIFSSITEDWWAVIVGFLLILMALLGLLGKNGLMITF